VGLGTFAVVLFVIAALAANANRSHGLRVDVLSARRTEPGTAETFTVSVRDTKGAVRAVRIDFGDGRVEDLPVGRPACVAPLSRTFDVEHAFDFTGYSTVAAVVETGDCGAATERAEAIRTVQVKTVRR
jgi:hypothetical protein